MTSTRLNGGDFNAQKKPEYIPNEPSGEYTVRLKNNRPTSKIHNNFPSTLTRTKKEKKANQTLHMGNFTNTYEEFRLDLM